MRRFWRERARPENDTACNQSSNEVLNTTGRTYLCARWSSDPTWFTDPHQNSPNDYIVDYVILLA